MRADYVNAVTLGIILLKLLKVTVMLLLCCTLVCLRSTRDCGDRLQPCAHAVISTVVLDAVMQSHAPIQKRLMRSSFRDLGKPYYQVVNYKTSVHG